jgi:hypothetical protein
VKQLPTEIKNAQISFVSLVDKAANKKKFAIIKAETNPTFEKSIPILKVDEEKRIVTGIVYEPDALDAHGEFMAADEIEKSAHQFLKDYRNIDKQHDFVAGQAEVVESWIAKEDGALGEQDIKAGAWLIAVHVPDDDTWGEIKKGELTGFSMGGVGERVEHVEKSETEQATGLLRLLKNFFGASSSPVQKGIMADAYNAKIKQSNFWNAFNTLENVLYRCCDGQCSTCMMRCTCNMETDPTKIQEALTEFSSIITEILSSGDNIMKSIGKPPESITKAGKKISSANMTEIKSAHEALGKLIELDSEGEGEEVKKEDIEKMVGEGIKKALEPVVTKLDAIEKGEQPGQESKDLSIDDVTKMVTDAVTKAMEPLAQRIEKVETARGVVKQVEADEQQATPVAKGYLEYFK